MIQRQPILQAAVFFSFQKRENPFFKMKKINFLAVTFMFLAHMSVPLLVLITFRSISALSWSFRKIQKSKISGNLVIMTSLPCHPPPGTKGDTKKPGLDLVRSLSPTHSSKTPRLQFKFHTSMTIQPLLKWKTEEPAGLFIPFVRFVLGLEGKPWKGKIL